MKTNIWTAHFLSTAALLMSVGCGNNAATDSTPTPAQDMPAKAIETQVPSPVAEKEKAAAVEPVAAEPVAAEPVAAAANTGIVTAPEEFRIKDEFSDPDSKYYSQVSQDRFVNETFFKDKKGGVFIEIGAYDGEKFSNTKYFEEHLGWTGLLIEPLPSAFEKLKKNRVSTLVNGCISSKAGKQILVNAQGVEMLSGLADQYDDRHLARIDREGGKIEKIEVECYNLNDLCNQHGIARVDFLSLDVEGAELTILNSIDFDKLTIDVLTIENNYNYPEIRTLMESKGYKLVRNLEMDEIYKKLDSSAPTAPSSRPAATTASEVTQATPSKKMAHLITYADDKFRNARERIKKEAIATSWFETVETHSPETIPDFYAQHKGFFERSSRGGGYWIWKAYIIQRKLKQLNEGEFLVYLDAGCTINIDGKKRFSEYIEMLNESDRSVLSFSMPHISEKCYTKADLFSSMGVPQDHAFAQSGMRVGGTVILKKTKDSVRFVDEWLRLVLERDYRNVDDSPSLIANDACFKEHRHDQSVFSLLSKLHETLDLVDETYPQPLGLENGWPFLATRLR